MTTIRDRDPMEAKRRGIPRDRMVRPTPPRSAEAKARNVATFARAAAQGRAARANAIEAVLARSPSGRRMLDYLAEAAQWRIHAALARELAHSAAEDLRRLRRVLDSRDALDQQRAAAALPNAEATYAKWCKAAQDYALRVDLAEAALRDELRALGA